MGLGPSEYACPVGELIDDLPAGFVPQLTPLPELEEPAVRFVVEARTQSEVGRASIAYHRHEVRYWARASAPWLLSAGLTYGVFGIAGLILGPVVCAVLLAANWRTYRSWWVWRYATSVAQMAPGTVLTTRFGPDAFDLQVGDVHRMRVHYGFIGRISQGPAVVVFRYGKGVVALPRELFPDSVIEHIRRCSSRSAERVGEPVVFPPLPPFPPLEPPTAVYVASEDTARLLIAAKSRERTRTFRITLVSTAVPYLLVFGLTHGLPATCIAAAVVAATLGAEIGWTARYIRFGARVFGLGMPPGTTFASRFGPGACDIDAGDFRLRFGYNEIPEPRVQEDVVLLGTGRDAHVYPRALFPDSALEYIRGARSNPPADNGSRETGTTSNP